MKPVTELTAEDIQTMSDDDFTMLLFVLGPVPLPSRGEVFMPQSDWERIESHLKPGNLFGSTLGAFATRAAMMHPEENWSLTLRMLKRKEN